MINLTISIFGNKIFFYIIKELKLFSKYKVNYYDNFSACLKEAENQNSILVFFINGKNKNLFKKVIFPSIFITKPLIQENIVAGDLSEQLVMPVNILEFRKKIILLNAKNEFNKNSLIYLNNYQIDKNERKIKKDNLELQLSEKEISFLILFSKKKEPISRNMLLKNVWKYSSNSETHTVETHIHRLRKKILDKFGDRNFIKNSNKGYYI